MAAGPWHPDLRRTVGSRSDVRPWPLGAWQGPLLQEPPPPPRTCLLFRLSVVPTAPFASAAAQGNEAKDAAWYASQDIDYVKVRSGVAFCRAGDARRHKGVL
jgi:hypothetical protein